jgi:hypothetical protein
MAESAPSPKTTEEWIKWFCAPFTDVLSLLLGPTQPTYQQIVDAGKFDRVLRVLLVAVGLTILPMAGGKLSGVVPFVAKVLCGIMGAALIYLPMLKVTCKPKSDEKIYYKLVCTFAVLLAPWIPLWYYATRCFTEAGKAITHWPSLSLLVIVAIFVVVVWPCRNIVFGIRYVAGCKTWQVLASLSPVVIIFVWLVVQHFGKTMLGQPAQRVSTVAKSS